MTAIVTALMSAAAAFIGTWVAAKLALDRFYQERIWERRAAAYTAIFEALHDQSEWYETHLLAIERGRDVSDEEQDKLIVQYNKASTELRRRIASETWLVSDQFRERINKLMSQLKERGETWIDLLEEGKAALEAATEDLRVIARKELNVP